MRSRFRSSSQSRQRERSDGRDSRLRAFATEGWVDGRSWAAEREAVVGIDRRSIWDGL